MNQNAHNITITVMGLSALVLKVALLVAGTLEAAAAQSKAGCESQCGNVSIPYPFGTREGCHRDPSFLITCDVSSGLPIPYIGDSNIQVLNISLDTGEMRIYAWVSSVCYNPNGQSDGFNTSIWINKFRISNTKNKFYVVGCDSYAYIQDSAGDKFTTGCMSICSNPSYVTNGSCSGVGCCQTTFPHAITDYALSVGSYDNHKYVQQFNPCSYAFVAEDGSFNFSTQDLLNLSNRTDSRLLLNWAVDNQTCADAKRNRSSYACVGNSECYEPESGIGYLCNCKDGFQGNPYLSDPDAGCKDIDECQESPPKCRSQEYCRNTIGSFECFCPPHYTYTGNGTTAGPCQPPSSESPLIMVFIGVSASLVALVVCVSWLCLVFQKRKLIKQKHKFFQQNGGFILQQRLSVRGTSSQTAKIFTSEELEKATNDYHDSLIIGTGGYGTVYKGFLAHDKIAAIKKSKLVHENQAEQFINEVVILSQINHRNVVKLLGCCLETEVPLLVYEFVNNGTLFDYIHDKSKASNVSWETHLRIAAEAAGALSYLHSSASVPIIHRDVKSSNILLDETCTTKVSDFGASKLVPLNQTELATIVQGTLGYLDPEYIQTNQLTEKSDVYSFGVVLVELLTGKKALSFDRPEEERCLAMHFLSLLNQGQLFDILDVRIVNNENREMLKEVALLAKRCLRLRGDERPTMKEVAMELEGIRKMGKHSWENKEFNVEETRPLLEAFDISKSGESTSYRNTGWDSITHHVLINLDDGR